MNGPNRLLVDTNMLVYLLDGNPLAARMLQDKIIYYSFITEIELLGVPGITAPQSNFIEKILSDLNKITYNDHIGKIAIGLKQKKKVKIPDAMIAATSLVFDFPLLTADKGFKTIPDLKCILFEL